MSGNPRIDGAEKRWKAYRNDLTEYVVKDAKQGEKVLVIGAGACDDLDLERLLEEDRQVFCWIAIRRRWRKPCLR